MYITDPVGLYALAIKSTLSCSFFFADNGEIGMIEVTKAISNLLCLDGKITSLELADVLNS